MSSAASRDRSRGGCPLCGQPVQAAFKPFCSRGCKDRDLLQWLGEGYRVAGPPADPESVGEHISRLDRSGGTPL